MRHLVKGRKLGRSTPHRKATLSALAVALIQERRIITTVPKAKELRRFVEPLITRAKQDSTHNRRKVFSKLNDKYAVTELFEEVGPLTKDRPGGYTRIIKAGFRQGDSSELAVIELVDFNDVPPEKADGKKRKTRRAGRSRSGGGSAAASGEAAGSKASASEAGQKPAAKSKKEETPETETGTAEAGGKGETASDFTVDQVKEKLDSMDLEEAKAFVGEDERVTVQKALQRKIDQASQEDSAEEE